MHHSDESIADASYGDADGGALDAGPWWFRLTRSRLLVKTRLLRLRRDIPFTEVRFVHTRLQLLRARSWRAAAIDPWLLVVLELRNGKLQYLRLVSPSMKRLGDLLLESLKDRLADGSATAPASSTYLKQRRNESGALRLFLVIPTLGLVFGGIGEWRDGHELAAIGYFVTVLGLGAAIVAIKKLYR